MRSNKVIYTLILIVFLTVLAKPAFAQDLSAMCANYGGSNVYFDTPPITALVCTGVRVLNYGFLLIGGVFVVMFVFGMYKYATAWGDPKGVQGAQQTVTTAIIGVIVAFGAVTILVVTGNVLGLNSDYLSGLNPFNNLAKAVCTFLDVARISCY